MHGNSRINAFVTILLITFSSLALSAQNQFKEEKFFLSLQFGGRNIHRDSLANTANIDFMNYLYRQSGAPEYGILALDFRLTPRPGLQVGIQTVFLSDLNPNQLNLNIKYEADSLKQGILWGLKGAFFAYPQYLNEFNQYHKIQDTGFTADLNTNYRQISVYDLGFAAGPYLSIAYKRLHGEIGINLGVSGFLPFNETIAQKKTEANLRREINYKTTYSAALFLNPEMEFCYDLNNSTRRKVGIMISAGSLLSQRSINYTRNTDTWTNDNTVTEKVKPGKILYSKTEIKGGFYISF